MATFESASLGLFFRLADEISRYDVESNQLPFFLCMSLRLLLGFDRVFFCEFYKTGEVEVLAEKSNGVLPSLLGYRYTLHDLNSQMLDSYSKNRIHYISNAYSETPSVDYYETASESGKTLPLEQSQSYASFLKGLDICSSAVFSEFKNKQLKYLFVCHSKEPTSLSTNELTLAQHLINLFYNRYAFLSIKENQSIYTRKIDILKTMMEDFQTKECCFKSFWEKHYRNVCNLMNSDDFICCYDGEYYFPYNINLRTCKNLIDFVSGKLTEKEIFYTNNLFELESQFGSIKQDVSGILAIALNKTKKDIFIWTRKEHVYDEKWLRMNAGKSSFEAAQSHNFEEAFKTYLNSVAGRSKLWESVVLQLLPSFKDSMNQVLAQHNKELANKQTLYLDAILKTAIDGIITINSNGIIQSFNDAAEKIYGYTSGEVVGQNVNILMPEPFSTEHDDYIQNFIRTGTKKIIGKRREVIARGKDGQLFPMELGVNAVQVNGEYYFVGVTQDISQRKAAENDLRNAKEAAEKANSYKSEFLANMSHELHTPLLNIMGIVASLQKQIADKNQKQNLNLILLNTKRLLTFIDDLLDLSKLDIGKMDFIFTKNRLIYTLEDAEKEVQKQLRQKNMKLLYNKKLADKELVFDKHRMEQVFLNLLSNAIKFTPKESPQKTKEIYLNFSEEMTNEKKKVFRIEVADQGIGIPQTELDDIFKKFRKSSKTKTETQGTGLGLAICSEIIAAHQGRIWAENNKWGGTSFFIELPLDGSLIRNYD